MQFRALILLAGTLSSLGCGPSVVPGEVAEGVETREDAIIGGTIAMGDPAVVSMAVRYGGYQSVCTGTLIGPKTVLTAAHCINAYGTNVAYYAAFGTYSSSPTRAVQVAQQYRHPSYRGGAWDFGLLRLTQPVLDVAPIPLNETPMTSSLIGRPIRHVGYGITAPNTNGDGIKREVTYNLRSIQQYTIESGAQGKQTCQGDSGGPGFMVLPGSNREVLVGVVSYGDENCAYQGFDGRVDVALNWIRTTMAQWETPTCATDGQCVQGCTPIDQDCACAANGVCGEECLDPSFDPDCPRDCVQNNICSLQPCGRPDPDCVPEGGYCSAAVQCRDRLCITDRQNPLAYCSKPCGGNEDCPEGMECAGNVCQVKQKPERQLYETCYRGQEFCVEGVCTGPAGGISRCVKPCLATSDCPSGSVCEAGADSQRFCRPGDLRFTNVVLEARPIVEGPLAAGCASTAGLAWALGAVLPLLRRRRAR
jgi:V8-like Glu-specific endopeptidase